MEQVQIEGSPSSSSWTCVSVVAGLIAHPRNIPTIKVSEIKAILVEKKFFMASSN
jgi:hypothetical protein